MREHQYFVYLLTNWNNRVMYVGMTSDLVRRLYEHRTGAVKGFTEKYNVHKLVYFEETGDVHAAIAREKEIKKWRREKKNALVIQANPQWRDLGNDLGLHASPTVNPTRTQDFSQVPSLRSGHGSK
ncbi:MAG: GIY-YIG nuclease family protein [Nitrospira sp.]|nr:GIY-YIG nuclease family protein [Nitrospira sp.]